MRKSGDVVAKSHHSSQSTTKIPCSAGGGGYIYLTAVLPHSYILPMLELWKGTVLMKAAWLSIQTGYCSTTRT
ncbi:hypothetical protein VTO42DRAFT_5495 [Malbranchea cinnamomea]